MKTILSNDALGAYTCALMYNLDLVPGERERYGDKALEILNDWASKNKSYSGGEGSLVVAYNGCLVPVSADLMYNNPGWSSAQHDSFAVWVRSRFLSPGGI